MSDFALRDARPEDQPSIRDATLAAYEEYAKVLPVWAWEAYKRDILSTLARPEPAEQIVAERDGEILGTVLLYPAGSVLELPDGPTFTRQFPEVRLLAVPPAARHRGIGEALMRECIERARRAGVPALSLHTTDFMAAAMRLYERMGFVRAPEIDIAATPEILIKGYRYSTEAQ